MQVKALPKSTTGITDEQCQGKQDAWDEGRRELTTMQVAKLFSAGRSSKEIAAPRPRFIGGAGNDKSAWWWTKEAATKSWRRDVHLQVSSLFLGPMDSTDYPCPWNTLHKESDGRSWAMNNTSNIPGVD